MSVTAEHCWHRAANRRDITQPLNGCAVNSQSGLPGHEDWRTGANRVDSDFRKTAHDSSRLMASTSLRPEADCRSASWKRLEAGNQWLESMVCNAVQNCLLRPTTKAPHTVEVLVHRPLMRHPRSRRRKSRSSRKLAKSYRAYRRRARHRTRPRTAQRSPTRSLAHRPSPELHPAGVAADDLGVNGGIVRTPGLSAATTTARPGSCVCLGGRCGGRGGASRLIVDRGEVHSPSCER